MTDEYMQLVGW